MGHAEVLLGVVRGLDGFHRPVAIKRMRSDLVDRGNFGPISSWSTSTASILGKLIKTGPVSHPVAIFIVREPLSGLGYMHESRDWDRAGYSG